jgi:SAM-dependent methyltransferase
MRPTDPIYRFHKGIYRIQCRLLAAKVDHCYRSILASWDQEAFIQRFRAYWTPFPCAESAKFLDLNVWFREAVLRYFWTGIARMPGPLRILDIGAGTGFFLEVCRQRGHQVTALDLDTDPLYNECIEFFKLERVIHRIQPGQPLPQWPGKFDVVTAFLTCFDELENGMPWRPEDWSYFLEDLKSKIVPNGRVIIKFNLNPRAKEFYSPATKRSINSLPGFQARFFLNYLFLRVL